MPLSIVGSENNLIKLQRGLHGEGYTLDKEGNYDMQNVRLTNLAISIDNFDVFSIYHRQNEF